MDILMTLAVYYSPLSFTITKREREREKEGEKRNCENKKGNEVKGNDYMRV